MAAVSSLIAGGTAIGGALIGSRSASRSADAIQEGSDAQVALARELYQDQRALNQPFYQTGVAANAAAAELVGVTPAQGGAYANNNTANPYGQNGSYGYNGGFGGGSDYSAGAAAFGSGGSSSFGAFSGGGFRGSAGRGGGVTNTPANDGGTFAGQNGFGGGASPAGRASNDSPIYQNAQLSALQQSPGYQFRMQEGLNTLDQSAAARGGLLSGRHLRSATQYGQDYASNEYNNRFNQLQALSGGGQAAASNTQNAGSNFGNTAGAALGQSASAQANLHQQRGSIYGGALGTVGGIAAGGIYNPFNPKGGGG